MHIRSPAVLPGILAAASLWLVAADSALGAEEGFSSAEVGRALFAQHCAVCHGDDARGGGEFSNLLKRPPPDLTRWAERRGGSFDALEVAERVDGRSAPTAHGGTEMPIWGERFSEHAAPGQGSESALRGRMMLLVDYLRSVQTGISEAENATAGSRRPEYDRAARVRFVRDCSPCHGVYGKGNGFLGVLLRQPPPDLTRIAQRRGGEFPTREVEEIIDGRREVRAHGPREMPIWGDHYRRAAAPSLARERVVRAELLLLVEYLRSIQAPPRASDAPEGVPRGD